MVGTRSRWASLVAATVLLAGIVGLAPAAGAAPPPFAISPLPTTVAAGSSLTVSGVGCPQTPPPTVTVTGQPLIVQLWRTAEGHNLMSSYYEGSAAASTWKGYMTAIGYPSEQLARATPAADGSWTVGFALPWFAAPGAYQVLAWCGTLGPAGPFDPMTQIAPAAPPLTATTQVTTNAAAPAFTHLADSTIAAMVPSDTTFTPPTPGAGDLVSITPGATIDISGTGCHPPSASDPPTQREVELVGSPVQAGAPPVGPTQQRIPYVSASVVQGGELQVEPLPLASPGGFLVRASVNPDGSWTASTTIPADSATTGTYVVVAQCLTGAPSTPSAAADQWQRASQVFGAVPLIAPSTTRTTTPTSTTVTPAFTG